MNLSSYITKPQERCLRPVMLKDNILDYTILFHVRRCVNVRSLIHVTYIYIHVNKPSIANVCIKYVQVWRNSVIQCNECTYSLQLIMCVYSIGYDVIGNSHVYVLS